MFNDTVAEEGKTEVVEAGDPDGTLFLINPDVSPFFFQHIYQISNAGIYIEL